MIHLKGILRKIKNTIMIPAVLVGILLIGFNPLYGQTYCFTAPQGYASGTTGGGNASPVTVTTQAALQSALTASGSGVILVSGTITCTYMSVLVTNKTLLGLPGARIRNLDQTKSGSGIFTFKPGSNNVIVRNLIFEGPGAYDTDGRDLMNIEGASKIWIDHCEFQDGCDGNLDNKGLTDNITISWCKFTYLKAPRSGGSGGTADHRFSNLVGSSDSDKPSDGKYSITWQYCWWAQGCVERMTRARNAQLDMVNCYWNSSVAKVTLGLGGVTDCYVQNSVFANSGDKYRYYNNGTVRLTTVGCTSPPANVGTCPAPSYTREAIAAGSVVSAVTGECGAGATLNVTTSGAVSAKASCGGQVNQSPTVSITSPTNNTSYTAPANITINATAADADGSVTKVDFYNGNTLIGTDASSPYSFSWTNVAAGTYSITARATDNSGSITTSTPISITVTAPLNQLPTVSITSPISNAGFTAPANITINATAADADGSVTKVDFYNGNTLIGTDASSPYSFSWTNVAFGTYTITARATDNSGSTTTSSAISVVVNPAGLAPTVSISSPLNNATFTAPASITLNATAADADGTITNVAFYNGTTMLGTDATAPYNFTWMNVATGTYTITAKATDNSGAVTTSSPITVVVMGLPGSDVTIQAETACAFVGVLETKNAGFNGESYVNVDNEVGTSITWSVNSPVIQTVNLTFRYAATTDRNMSLSVNGTMQVPAVSLPATGAFTTWNTSLVQITLAAGTNRIVVSSLTSDGGPNIDELTFNSHNITTGSCSQVPTVSITSPSNNASFTAPASITIQATAADADGSISRVDFYNGTTLLGSDASSPYSFSWTNVASGTYVISARAVDNDGAISSSSAINITVNAPANQHPVVSISSPSENVAGCLGTVFTLTATASDPDGSITKVEFYDGNTLVSTVTSFPYTYGWSNAGSGTHSITAKATDNAGGFTTSTAIVITVHTIPSAPAIISPVVYCQNASAIVALTATGTGLKWYTASTNGTGSASAPIPATNLAGTTNYYVSQTNNGCESARAMITVTVNATPSAPSVVTPLSYCLHASTTALTATGTGLKWYTTSTNGSASASAPVPATNVIGSTNYYVSQTNNGCESARAMIAVTVNATPSAPSVVTPLSYCQHASSTALTATGTGLKWYAVSTNGSALASAPVPATNVTGTTNYYVSQTNNGCESARATIAVTINPLPSASITAGGPTTFIQGGSVVLSANTGTGSTYRWLNGPTQVGTGPAYTATTSGNYTLEVTNSSGCKTTSIGMVVTVNGNEIPLVNITAPANNASFMEPTSMAITATATDSDGSISKVDFYDGHTLLGSDNNAPYSFTWANAMAGTHSITAVATDNLGATATSGVVTVIVNANQAPTVSITSPANHATFTSAANVTITATAADADGTLASVSFYNGTTLLGSDNNAPYSFDFNNLSAGDYTLTAKAKDNLGAETTSSIVSITVNQNQSSVIDIISPVNNSSVSGSVTIDVNVTDPDGSITLVEYLDGTTVIGSSSSQPYTFVWDNPSDGTHTITVRVTDSHGGVTSSTPVTVTTGTSTGILSGSYSVFSKVYPNPSLEAFTVKASQGILNLSVIDMYGIEVLTLKDIPADQQVEIGNELSEGTYVLVVKYTSEKIEVAKLIKIK